MPRTAGTANSRSYLPVEPVGAAALAELAGGLYGVAVGGLFAGESMFHAAWPQARDASKAALVGLVTALRADADPRRLIDVQWCTAHLATLGCVEVSREHYLRLLDDALDAPLPSVFTRRSTYVVSPGPNGETHSSAGQPHRVGGTVLE